MAKTFTDILFSADKETTFLYEPQLPSLPVPDLEATLAKYLDSVRPLVSPEELAVTEALVKDFKKGTGIKLHKKLEERAANSRNWLEKWWVQKAYLEVRQPMVPNQSMMGANPRPDFWPSLTGSRVERTALVLYFVMKFWSLLRREKLKPFKTKGKHWSMDQLKKVFNTNRVPGPEADSLHSLFKTSSDGSLGPTNVIVLCRGYIFSFDCIDSQEEPLSPGEFAENLEYIEEWCSSQPSEGPGVGALTSGHRSVWAENREYIINLHPINGKHLQTIENALFAVSFEDSEPVSQQEVFGRVLEGEFRNRWLDKSVTLVEFKNGSQGSIVDHTPADAICALTMLEYVNASLVESKGLYDKTIVSENAVKPQRLDFVVDAKVESEVKRALSETLENVKRLNTHFGVFDEFGKALLKSHKFHPEYFIQVALQLAYLRMHGKPASTYATASTRQYYNGRTETLRSCVPETVDFARAVVEGLASPKELHLLLTKALKKLDVLMTEAMEARGCDRHLLGLYLISQEDGLAPHPLFTDPSFAKSGGGGNFTLSTSCIGYAQRIGAYCPMTSTGYCSFYSIEDNRITFCNSDYADCPETNCEAFFESIRKSLLDVQNILGSASDS